MRKKLIALVLGLTAALCAGCAQTPPPAASAAPTDAAPAAVLPGEFPMEFVFSSGAGAWMTVLTLNADGSFSGQFHDSNMGELGKDYPNGTVYVCSFTGKFIDPVQLDGHSYRMQLTPPVLERPAGDMWIKDGIRYISSNPYGLDGGLDFVFYTPDTPVAGLDEEFLSWWPDRGSSAPITLNRCALWNVDAGTGFFTC